ncbi:MAG: hypothetical protein CMH55_01495 [Myxococcales bacterium]|nr:hypothetical protein [Myxococcales bacterium]
MKRFRFRLDALLRLKQRKRQEAEQLFASCQRDLIAGIDALGRLDERLGQGFTTHDPQLIRTEEAFLGRLRVERRAQAERVAELQKRLQKASEAMLQAKREEESVLSLRDKAKAAWRKDALKEVQSQLDDLGYRSGL